MKKLEKKIKSLAIESALLWNPRVQSEKVDSDESKLWKTTDSTLSGEGNYSFLCVCVCACAYT